MRRALPIVVILTLLTSGCRRADNPAVGPQPVAPASSEATIELDADDPIILKRPFTAEEIRAEMIEFFFVPAMPGAPVLMRILAGQNTVFELEQLERQRPEGP